MAGISLSRVSGINPTSPYIPYNGGAAGFLDSPLRFDTSAGGRLATWYAGQQKGLLIENNGNLTTIGDSITIKVGSGLPGVAMTANGAGITSGSSGGASGQHLVIGVNGTGYKIPLNNP